MRLTIYCECGDALTYSSIDERNIPSLMEHWNKAHAMHEEVTAFECNKIRWAEINLRKKQEQQKAKAS